MQSVFKHNLFLFCNQMPMPSSFLLTNTFQITFLSLFFHIFSQWNLKMGIPENVSPNLLRTQQHQLLRSFHALQSRQTVKKINQSIKDPRSQKNQKRINNKTRKKKTINKPRAVLNQTVLKMA